MNMNRPLNINEISTFLNQFSDLEESLYDMRIKQDIRIFNQLFKALGPVDKRIQKILLTTAPEYNVFNVLNICHYETKVHTPFLKHLLNPEASHRQGRLFFDSFMNLIFGNEYIVSDVSNIQVFEEFYTKFGRIDILILYKSYNQNSALVIENKIYHHDEDAQLERYYTYLTQDRKLTKGHYHLVYLKPNKGAPSRNSISIERYRMLKEEKSLFEIGYRQDIAPWLESVVTQVKAANVEQTLLQYIKTIKTL